MVLPIEVADAVAARCAELGCDLGAYVSRLLVAQHKGALDAPAKAARARFRVVSGGRTDETPDGPEIDPPRRAG